MRAIQGGLATTELKEATDAARSASDDGVVDSALVAFALKLIEDRDAFTARPKRNR